jgi:hypothetical protein
MSKQLDNTNEFAQSGRGKAKKIIYTLVKCLMGATGAIFK